MPPKKYISITMRREVYERLEELKANLKYSSISDLLVFLVEFYVNNSGVREEIGKLAEALKRCVEEITKLREGG